METEDGQVQENRYDAEGLRFELLENGKRTRFVYHQGELLHEEGGDENQSSYHLGAGIETFRRDGEYYYYHQDEQLSTAFITGSNGSIHNTYQYDAFGVELEKAEQLSNRIRYTGQQYDSLTEQYYLRARYYNPVLGRFMQEDVYQGDGLNLYAYCDNNPVIYYDPSGYGSDPQQNPCANANTGGDGSQCDTEPNGNSNRQEGGSETLSGTRFPEDPNQLFPENYAGLTKEVKPNGNITYTVEAGGKTYKIEYHVKHEGDGHYDGNHYHVLKLGETPKPGKTKPPFFRLPNLDPNTPAQGHTFAPGDLLPTKNNQAGGK